MNILLSPHQDDAVLFACFTLLREHPTVIDILDSYIQPARGYPNCEARIRNREEMNAVTLILGCDLWFLGHRDDAPDWAKVDQELRKIDQDNDINDVYAPAVQIGGHDHHNHVGSIAERIWGQRVTYYMTYTSRGKSTGIAVPYKPEWATMKLKALACYESQIALPNCVEHFLRPQVEYYQAR